jgi:hypothetical protein
MREVRRPDERGTALLLVIASVVIVTLLGAVAINAAGTFTGVREANDAAAGIANDLAVRIDDGAFYVGGDLRSVESGELNAAAAEMIGNRPLRLLEGATATAEIVRAGEDEVIRVTVAGVVAATIGRSIPTVGSSRSISISSDAVLRQRDD